ncbi:P-loop containing nucleoside triphosphate hydrolase protein [Stipitochalara longipes BDJ]|nr:P-loop containing nucleoside triphosphate hydrolase protein [Stipitochalara longipes BDJ]
MAGGTPFQHQRQNEGRARGILNRHIYKTYEDQKFSQEWRNLPEIPSMAEICPPSKNLADVVDTNTAQDKNPVGYQNDPVYDQDLPHNIVEGPWPSKEAYLGAHYQMLREDAVAPLRRAVAEFKKCPSLADDSEICVYQDMTIKGLKLSNIGVAFRIEFSPQKQIKWKQSKRLLPGTMVAISKDLFKSDCRLAVVVGRGLNLLEQNPPAIELFWADSEDAVIDPVNKYIMIEAREGYFEASRHVLVALQKLMTEKFELENHIVHLDRDIKAPRYVENQPLMDLSSLHQNDDLSVASEEDADRYINVDVLREFPKDMHSGMDKSQMVACEKMLTSRVAIVQGPPGTGKTYTSISTLNIMVQNLGPNDPPIVVAAQTNHALDQLLNHILTFEPNIVRLGGRSNKANEEILKRTLFKLRRDNNVPGARAGFRQSHIQLDKCKHDVMTALETLTIEYLLNGETLMKNGLITESQYKSLYERSNWEGEDSRDDIAKWLTEEQIMPVPETTPINLGLEVEQADIEEEEVEDIDNEFKTDAADEESKLDDEDGLEGVELLFKRKFTGRHSFPSNLSDKKIKQKLASLKNLYDIPLAHRGEFYRFFEKAMNKNVLKELKVRLKEYQDAVNGWTVTKHLSSIRMIRHLGIRIIGCTTTGLSKYRSLLSAVEPRVLLVEEAAETLEGNVIGGLIDSIQHLILVGDHQQLQAHCTVRALEEKPYHMNISMFERLVSNSFEYVMLNVQRRMIRDVRKLLCRDPNPFYEDLQDHPSVLDRLHNRPPVPGMGGLDTYFFHHDWPDAMNAECSRYNLLEAEFIARFFLYLCQNGVDASKITVLTFYNGQKATLIRELDRIPDLKAVKPLKVFTVDSYQGEENDIILLSLVRGNRSNLIGFLDSKNRLVVALSRARRGMYIFGNAITLMAAETTDDFVGREPLWSPLVNYMTDQLRFNVDGGLPVTCDNHGKITRLYESYHFDQVVVGGCDTACGGTLLCGHPCKIQCHPLGHECVQCREACPRTLTCGHKCSAKCSAKCYCQGCGLWDGQFHLPDYAAEDAFADTPTPWGDSPTKNPAKSPASDHLAAKHFAFVAAKNSTFAAHDARIGRASGSQSIEQLSPRSASRQLTDTSGNLTSIKYGDARLSTPNTPRSHTIRSRGSTFSSQTSIVKECDFGRSNFSPVSPGAWKNWDAKKSDEVLAEQYRLEDASTPKVDRTKLVFNETYIPTSLNEKGERFVSSGSRRRTVGRSNLEFGSLDTVLRHDGAGGDALKKEREFEARRDRLTSPTEVYQANKLKVRAASKALVDVTNDMSNIRKKGTLLPAFGDEPERFVGSKFVDQHLQSKLEDPTRSQRGGRHGGDYSLRGSNSALQGSGPSISNRSPNYSPDDDLAIENSPRGGYLRDSFRGGDLLGEDYLFRGQSTRRASASQGRGQFRGDSFGDGNLSRGWGSSQGTGAFRGNNYSMRGRRGSRGTDSLTARGLARGFPNAAAYPRGGRQPSEETQQPATGDLLGLNDSPVSETRSGVIGDIIDLYTASPPRRRAQRNTSARGVEPSTPERPIRPAAPAPRTPNNTDTFEERLINFD